MIYFLMGIGALGALLYALEWLVTTRSFKVARLATSLVVVGFVALAIFLIMTGRWAGVIPIAVAAIVSFWRTPKNPRGHDGASRPNAGGGMSQAEALDVLGLKKGASPEEVKAAHRRLISRLHPDQGGTSYLAQRVNEAKDILLKK